MHAPLAIVGTLRSSPAPLLPGRPLEPVFLAAAGGEDEGEDLAREERRHTQNKSYDEPDAEEAAMAESARREAEGQELLEWGDDDEEGQGGARGLGI
jgi:hypothetical protein